ncbi:unnamed protein product, partial [Ectocarpus sp. 4 AP-2014]
PDSFVATKRADTNRTGRSVERQKRFWLPDRRFSLSRLLFFQLLPHLAVRTQPAFAKTKQNTPSRNNGRVCAIKFTEEAPLTNTGCISPPQIPRETRKGREKGTKAAKHVNAHHKIPHTQ